jgi:uncharacterized protein YndB with AHSA1/START domain
MEATTDARSLEREVTIDAPPETVWEFLVDPEKATRWMGQSARFDARPGGEYRCDVIPGHTAAGRFVEVEPPHRLVFTWGWEPGEDGPNPVAPGSSTIEIELERSGRGTKLHFTHRDLPSSEAAASHAHGWDHYLPRLVTAGSGGDPGADPWLSGDMT